ncbi:MAG TPA: flagellin [Clostridia bacterium]|nr:flagellin [Clostridia bacterium]
MALSILNNIPSLAAQNQLSITGSGLQKTLFRLSSGSRINSGADDAAGLAIADGLRANVTALSQSARNATDGIGKLQVADGALSQVSSLLNRAVTLATEASTGTVNPAQREALDAEFLQIKQEIDRIGSKTTYNGEGIFGAGSSSDPNKWVGATGGNTSATVLTAGQTMTITDTDTGLSDTYTVVALDTMQTLMTRFNSSGNIGVTASLDATGHLQIADKTGNGSIVVSSTPLTGVGAVAKATISGGTDVYLSDGTTAGGGTIATTISALSSNSIGTGAGKIDLSADDLKTATKAQTALTKITSAIANVASDRGTMGAVMNRLESASNVITNQVQNLTAAEDGIRSADIAREVANMTKFNILNQTGISALAQANQMQQGVLSLLR